MHEDCCFAVACLQVQAALGWRMACVQQWTRWLRFSVGVHACCQLLWDCELAVLQQPPFCQLPTPLCVLWCVVGVVDVAA